MATTTASSLVAALVAAGATLLAIETAMGASGSPRISLQNGPITLVADAGTIDYGVHHVTLKNVVISQGDLRLTADRADASGIDFDNSHWTFTSNVHITSARLGVLQSDKATVEFRNNHLESALATGQPAEFEQTTSKTGMFARGHADSIEYTVATDNVRLTGNARLEYSGTVTTAPVVIYNIRDQRLQFAGAAAPGERVHIIATPQKAAKPGTTPTTPARARHAAPNGASGPPP